jgi:hypothetical protein
MQKTRGDGAPTPAVNVGKQIGRHEKALLQGDLSELTAQERRDFYAEVVESIGLNPMTKPLEYIYLSGELTLYANKTAAAQLRDLHGISVTNLDITQADDLYTVFAHVQDRTGRTDVDAGMVAAGRKSGEALANARMKAITKAKRRATLSICGLGFLDETEVDDIPDSATKEVNVDHDTGEIKQQKNEKWYRQATEWLKGLVKDGKDPAHLLAHFDGIPDDHPVDDWPEERAQNVIAWMKKGQHDSGKAQGAASAPKSAQTSSGSGEKTEHQNGGAAKDTGTGGGSEAPRYDDAQDALESIFNEAWADGNEGLEPISDAQLNRLYAIADDNDWKEAALNRLVKDELGYESKKDVPYGDPYDEICAALEDERLRYHMSRDPDTPDMFSGDGLQEDAEVYEQKANAEAFEDGTEDDDLPF